MDEGRNDDTPPAKVTWPTSHEADEITALAFTFNGQTREITHPVTIVAWTEQAHAYLQRLVSELGTARRMLPRRALRTRLEIAESTSLRLDRDLGMGQSRVIMWCQRVPDEAKLEINDAILGWLTNDVQRVIDGRDDATQTLSVLKDLVRARTIVTLVKRIANPFAWGVTRSKTAKAATPTSYADLADYVARQVEGKIVFPDLGPLRRVASGDLNTGTAELITDPIPIGNRSRFSLVLRFQVLTYPGRPTPIVEMQVSRRVWVTALKGRSNVKTITAYALPAESTRAFPFTLEIDRTAPKATGNQRYQPGHDFGPIERRYFLGQSFDADKILRMGYAQNTCQLLVGLRHGSGERSQIKHGVPDVDKMAAFRALTTLLADRGLMPWTGVEVIDKERAIDDMEQHWSRRDESHKEHEKYHAWRADAEASLRSCYDRGHHLVIGVQRDGTIEADALGAKQLLQEILGDSVVTTLIPIPADAHGPRETLPDADLKNPERARTRMEAWQPFIEAVRTLEHTRRVDGVLILARRWYGDENPRPDDSVNKRSARIALARTLGKPVQYLLPRDDDAGDALDEKQKGRAKRKDDFEQRLMMAWLDLAYKSIGRVRPGKVKEKAQALYEGEQLSFFNGYPDRVIALGVIRRNKTRYLRNERSFVPFAIELDVESGICRANFAYEAPATHQLTWSPMLPLPQALMTLARLGPVQLYSRHEDVQNYRAMLSDRTQTFFRAILAERCRDCQQPLIIIDANTSRSVWPWLTDENVDPANVHLAGGYNEQESWPHARLVRVRTENSPKVLQDAERVATVIETQETIQMHAPRWAEATLFRLTDTRESNVYLSFGSYVRRNRIRGRSCYRSVPGFEMKAPKGGKSHYVAATVPPYTDAWTTPSGVEIVVLRHGRDSANQIAQLTAWLRQCYEHFGAWTTKPAPLFFERVLKEYLADFEFEDEEAPPEEEAQDDLPDA